MAINAKVVSRELVNPFRYLESRDIRVLGEIEYMKIISVQLPVGRRCKRSKGMNHFAICYKTQQSAAVNKLVNSDSDRFFLGSVTDCSRKSTAWYVNLKVCSRGIPFKIDTGADTFIISELTYRSLPVQPQLKPMNTVLQSLGCVISRLGSFKVLHSSGLKY